MKWRPSRSPNNAVGREASSATTWQLGRARAIEVSTRRWTCRGVHGAVDAGTRDAWTCSGEEESPASASWVSSDSNSQRCANRSAWCSWRWKRSPGQKAWVVQLQVMLQKQTVFGHDLVFWDHFGSSHRLTSRRELRDLAPGSSVFSAARTWRIQENRVMLRVDLCLSGTRARSLPSMWWCPRCGQNRLAVREQRCAMHGRCHINSLSRPVLRFHVVLWTAEGHSALHSHSHLLKPLLVAAVAAAPAAAATAAAAAAA